MEDPVTECKAVCRKRAKLISHLKLITANKKLDIGIFQIKLHLSSHIYDCKTWEMTEHRKPNESLRQQVTLTAYTHAENTLTRSYAQEMWRSTKYE